MNTMYNRYIPQPDGSYRRNRMPDNLRQPSQTPRQPQGPHREQPKQEHREPEAPRQEECRQPDSLPREPEPARRRQEQSVGSFLKQLLPKGFDTGDLLIVLLLLLMAGDCAEDQNTALLTLVLYLFM